MAKINLIVISTISIAAIIVFVLVNRFAVTGLASSYVILDRISGETRRCFGGNYNNIPNCSPWTDKAETRRLAQERKVTIKIAAEQNVLDEMKFKKFMSIPANRILFEKCVKDKTSLEVESDNSIWFAKLLCKPELIFLNE